MRFAAVALSCIALAAAAGPKKGSRKKAGPPSLCAAGEKVLFTCNAGDKKAESLFSLCGSADLMPKSGTAQLRVRVQGGETTTWPASPEHPSKFVTGTFSVTPVGMLWTETHLFIQAGATRYTLSEGVAGRNTDGIPPDRDVLAETAGTKQEFTCTNGALDLGEDSYGIELKNPDETEEVP